MAEKQNSDGYCIVVDDFFDSVYEASRMEVLDGFEEVVEQVTDNLERFRGYEEIEINYEGPMVQTFAGPVMKGPARENSRSYQLSTDSEVMDFDINVKDSSMAFMESGQGLTLDTENEYRDLVFSHKDGSKQLYNDFIEEFGNLLAVDGSQYRRNKETDRWEFKFQRKDLKGL
jgi:hypothetical protein